MKSQDEFYLSLHAQLISRDPLETSSSRRLSLKRDLLTLRSRFHNEGLSFLTKTLPKLGKSLDQGLVSGRLNLPGNFRVSSGTSIPAFMQEYFSLVFDKDGFLLDVVPVEAIRHLRQVLYFSYKLEVPYSPSENSRVIEEFKKVDSELQVSDDPLALEIISLAKIITWKVFHDFNHKDIHPRHGPGAVATGEKLEDKWVFNRLYNSIHQVYPYYDYYVTGGARELSDRLDWYRSLRRLESGAAKVVLVPKDSRGPRLISCEPLEYQWIQQGLGRKISEFLEKDSIHTRRHVNFKSQEINRSIALRSSATKYYATLDLKDASDRVSLGLVRSIFENTPTLLRALEACRTTDTRLPDGSVVHLNKYAPMGSALCFPVEAYLFWVIMVSAVIHSTNLPLVNVERRIFVYGDDIIVPTNWAPICIQALELMGLKVNLPKSCITGSFRESCGLDAFKGIEVTPTRLSTPWSGQSTDGSALASYVSLANALHSKGYLGASDLLWTRIEAVYGNVPYGTSISSFPCRIITSPLRAVHLNRETHRWRVNRSFQRIEFSVLRLRARRIQSKLDGWPRLMRNMVTPPYGDPSVVVLPRSTQIKRSWMSVL